MTSALVVGRVGVDLTPARPRTSLAAADGFVRAVGGFAGNIGTGLARLGVATGVVSAVGDDGHGDHVRVALAGEGIDVSLVRTMAGARTQVAFFEAWPPDRFPVTFYRLPPAPDTLLGSADLADGQLDDARLVIVSAALLAVEPARPAVLDGLGRRATAGGRPTPSWTLLDLDWRPTLWPDPSEYPGLIARALGLADVVIGSDEEFAAARLAPEEALAAGGEGSRLVVLKHGPDGASLLTRTDRRRLPGIAVEVICGLGAGDALTAAFGAGLVAGLQPVAALERGNAAGAIVASRLMCSSAMPTAAEIEALIGSSAAGPREAHA
ncbi:MAG: PfkB family carbohydrate kinase [Candidatus Limnocylindrales bacterium]